MDLTSGQRATLAAILDTFAPGDGVAIPPASAVGSVELVAELAGPHAVGRDDEELTGLLGTWDNRIFASTVLGTRGRRFADLSAPEREQVMVDLANSRFHQKRILFKRLRNMAMQGYYLATGPTGQSPVWDAIGYPPPPPRKRLRGRALRALKPISPTRYEVDASTSCDVVIVGSGAGGSTAAAVLAEAGLDVLVLEKGEYVPGPDVESTELDALTRLYSRRPFWTEDAGMYLLAGSCLGGGTVVGYSGYYRLTDAVRSDWDARGLSLGNDFDAAQSAVFKRVAVSTDYSTPAPRDRLFESGAGALGLPVRTVERGVIDCDEGVECGRCGMGCRLGAKQSSARNFLADAQRRGARVVTGATARSIETRGGRARTVLARTSGGSWLTVQCQAVVLAAGAIESPALLHRSGLGGPHVGRHLHLHPITATFGVFDEPVRPYFGTMSARFVDEHADLDGHGHGVRYETAALTPSLAAAHVPWRSAAEHLNLMRQLPHLAHVRVMARDRGAGEVRFDRAGEPSVRYTLAEADRGHLRTGIDTSVRMLVEAGAKRVFTGHQRGANHVPGEGNLDAFLAGEHAAGYGPGELQMFSQEAMSTVRMGDAERRSAADPEGALWDTRNVVVADASMLPSAAGVHPMGVVQALAQLNAQALAARLR